MKRNSVYLNEKETSNSFFLSLNRIQEYVYSTGKLCVYGTGKFAKILKDFLKKKQWKIDIFLVSDTEMIAEQYVENVPIVHISENPFRCGECKIILALDEKYVDYIQEKLLQDGYKDILALGNEFFFFLDIYNYFCLRMKDIICDEKNIRRQIEERFRKYRRIIFHEVLVSRFGPMLMFLIQKRIRDSKNQDILNVHIPLAIDYRTNKKFLLDEAWNANEYFYDYLKRNFLFASKQDIGLWKTIIEEYPEKVSYSRQYSLEGLAAYQHKKQNQVSAREYMFFQENEIAVRKKEIKEMGIGEKYVCFSARSEAYFRSIPGYNIDESQSRIRNCSIEKFVGMSRCLKEKGYQSIRMGALVDTPINAPDIIDYAIKHRTESMDFFLISQSKFVVCQFSGFHLMAVLFNKPTILTDSIQMTVQGDSVDLCNPQQDIMLLKKIWSPYSKRLMTLQEILAIEEKIPDLFQRTNYYREHGYRFFENTEEEIAGAAIEMAERLDGSIEYDEEYYSMQNKIKELRDASVRRSGNMYFDIPIGWHFIKNNRWLLD